jgi:hypothetical protein
VTRGDWAGRLVCVTEHEQQDPGQLTEQRDAAGLPQDDEQRSQERIEETGEPERDALGNEDGAS